MKAGLAAIAVILLIATASGQYVPPSGVAPPRVKKEFKPVYTLEGQRARIEGVVWVEAVVQPNGRIRDPKVIRSHDKKWGLDKEAVKAARQWQFIPATKDGKPVEMLVTIELSFKLK